MEVSGQLHAPDCFTPRQDPHWIGGWVGPRASLDMVAKRTYLYHYQESAPIYPAHNLVTIVTNLSLLLNKKLQLLLNYGTEV